MSKKSKSYTIKKVDNNFSYQCELKISYNYGSSQEVIWLTSSPTMRAAAVSNLGGAVVVGHAEFYWMIGQPTVNRWVSVIVINDQ